jgi:hypothetical protein
MSLGKIPAATPMVCSLSWNLNYHKLLEGAIIELFPSNLELFTLVQCIFSIIFLGSFMVVKVSLWKVKYQTKKKLQWRTKKFSDKSNKSHWQ